MDRVNGANWIDIGGGKRGFRDEDVVAGVSGTDVPALFLNGLQENVATVIEKAGLGLDATDWELLWQAIRLQGGLDVLRHMPTYPQIETATNALVFSVGSNQPLVNAGQTWLWRGHRRFSSDDFVATAGDPQTRRWAVVANKTYHVVWDAPGTGLATPEATYPNGRFSMLDMAGLTETDTQYDSTYDRMLCARVVTDGANVPTVTPLANAAVLMATHVQTGTASGSTYASAHHTWSRAFQGFHNWARTPRQFGVSGHIGANGITWTAVVQGGANHLFAQTLNRYSWTTTVSTDWDGGGQTAIDAKVRVTLGA